MPVTFDASVGTATANSYCDVAFADDYLLSARLNADAWGLATEATKQAALMWATRILDETMTWIGVKRKLSVDGQGNVIQRLDWPRAGAVDKNGMWFWYDGIPPVVMEATAEQALALLTKDRTKEPDLFGNGFSDASVSGLSVKVDRSQILPLIPRFILAKLQFVGSANGLGEGTGWMMKALRT